MSQQRQTRLWLDADVVHWFKTQAGGKRGYQTAIDAALRNVVEAEMRAQQSGGEDQP